MPFYYLTLFLAPFQNHWLTSFNFHNVTPVKIAGGLALLCALWSLNDSQTRVYFQSQSRKYFGLFAAFLCLSMAANGFNITSNVIFTFFTIGGFYVTTVTLVNTRERLFASCVVLLVAMGIASAYMVRQYLQFGPIYAGFRPGGVFTDANYYAASALAVLPIAYFLRQRSASKLLSLFCLGTVGAISVGLLLSQSRAGMIGLATVVLALLYESRARLRVVASLCVVATLVAAFSPFDPLRRFSLDTRGVSASTETHSLALQSGLNMTRDNPFFGVGLGNFKSRSMEYNADLPAPLMAHCSFLELAADNGLAALILYLLMCLAVMKDIASAKCLHRHDPVTIGILNGMHMGVIGFLTAAMFLSAEYEKIPWLIFFLAITTSRLEPKIEDTAELDDLESEHEDLLSNEVLRPSTYGLT